MTPANAHRGEIKVRLDADYVLRPDFEAMAAIDDQLGSIIDVTRKALTSQSLSFREISVIVCEGIRAHGRATDSRALQCVNLSRVQQLVYEAGLLSLIEPVLQFLTAAVTGGAEPGNVVAADGQS